jgi:hypothetical protein
MKYNNASKPKVYFNYGGNQPTTVVQYQQEVIPNRNTAFTFGRTSTEDLTAPRYTYSSR